MKNLSKALLILLLVVVTLGGCKKEPQQKEESQQKEEPFILKNGTYLYLNIEKQSMKAGNETKPLPKDQNLTPEQIIKVADGILATASDGTKNTGRAIGEEMKDFENCRIKQHPYDIICPYPFMVDGKRVDKFILLDHFIAIRDVRLIATYTPELGLEPGELIGYIPNAKMEKAEKAIREAWAKGDNEAVYKFFNDAYTFIPIRKGAYDELVKQGKN